MPLSYLGLADSKHSGNGDCSCEVLAPSSPPSYDPISQPKTQPHIIKWELNLTQFDSPGVVDVVFFILRAVVVFRCCMASDRRARKAMSK